MRHRSLQVEWLDSLPADDPHALGSRRDLHRLNAWMGHARLAARALRSICGSAAPDSLVDLGGGDGRFVLEVARRLPGTWRGTKLTLVDSNPAAVPATLSALTELGWHARIDKADVLDWLKGSRSPGCHIFLANLFLHHFSDAQLIELFSLCASQGRALVALEPCRSFRAALGSRLCRLIGCNAVTRHDAPASVAAGFAGHELSRLWPQTSDWQLLEGSAGFFTHQFIACSASAASVASAEPLPSVASPLSFPLRDPLSSG